MKEEINSYISIIYSHQDIKPKIQKILEARQAINSLPQSSSLIALDIIITVSLSYINNQETTVKSLWACLPKSNTGIRFQYNKLLKDGWLTTSPHENDSRVKIVQPTDKLIKLLKDTLLAEANQ